MDSTLWKRPPVWLLLFVLLFPLVQTYLYFDVMKEWSPVVQKGVYSFTKIVMFLLPIVYLGMVRKEKIWVRTFSTKGLLEGSLFGALVFIGMCLIYYCWLKPIGLIGPGTPAAEEIIKKVTAFGISTPLTFVLFGGFVSLIHSGLEEYYWRWFAFGMLKKSAFSVLWGAIISGTAFSLHHIIILGTYIGYVSPLTWLFTLGIAIGGAYWAWLYHRTDSIWAPWLSHAWADVAIFVIGYDLVFGGS